VTKFPRLYPILDAGVLAAKGVSADKFARALRAAGVTLLQYRDKEADDATILKNAELISDIFAGSGARLIMNDRMDLMLLAGWDGVHVGQKDMAPADVRIVVGDGRVIGVSTHTEEQVRIAADTTADYVAIGPVFATGTKLDAEPVVGLEGVRRARTLTSKPLDAIGGITRANARSVVDAGADSVAVISGLLASGEPVEKVVGDFLEVLR